jgi:hypothetical protein
MRSGVSGCRKEGALDSTTASQAAALLTPTQRRSLQRLAGLVIAPCEADGMPGADDPLILRDIEASLGRDAVAIQSALSQLAQIGGGEFTDQSAQQIDTTVQAFRQQHAALAAVVEEVVARCYYRDDRVMRAIGMEPRAPFPKGFVIEQGDFDLLDPVRARGPIYRDA